MASIKRDYEIDYAYIKSGTSEFDSVHVALVIGNENLTLLIESEEKIEPVDLETLLMGLQKSQLKRMRLNLKDDCKCVLACHDKSYFIQLDYDGDKIKVQNLVPIVD